MVALIGHFPVQRVPQEDTGDGDGLVAAVAGPGLHQDQETLGGARASENLRAFESIRALLDYKRTKVNFVPRK